MKLTFTMPRQQSSAPILAVAILLGLLLSPILERALELWIPTTVVPAVEQQPESSTWDLRTMWY